MASVGVVAPSVPHGVQKASRARPRIAPRRASIGTASRDHDAGSSAITGVIHAFASLSKSGRSSPSASPLFIRRPAILVVRS